MASYENVRMRRDCVERVSRAIGRKLSEEEASEMLSSFKGFVDIARRQDPEKWMSMSKLQRTDAAAQLYQQSRLAEAEKIKQRAYLTVVTQKQMENRLAFERKSGHKGMRAVAGVLQYVDRKVHAAQNEFSTALLDKLNGIQKGFLAWREDTAMAHKVIREIFGEDTGSKLAKQAAKAFQDVIEAQRIRFNRAGGNLGKLEHYFPQTHSVRRMVHAAEVLAGQGRIRQNFNTLRNTVVNTLFHEVNTYGANKAAWVNFIADKLDRNRYLDANGDLMNDNDFFDMLGRVYDRIITDGDFDADVSTVAGESARQSAARANRGDLHRALHFKDAESFMQYHDTFGDGGYFDVMLRSVRKTAKDIALLEEMGPNPNAMYRGLQRVGQAEVNKGNMVQGRLGFLGNVGLSAVDAMWKTLNGDANRVTPGRELFASASQGARNMEVVGKLQSTLLASVSDVSSYFVSAYWNKTPLLTATANLLKAWGSDSKELAIRAGMMADVLSNTIVRWGEANVGEGWTGKLANFTMRVSLLEAWTNGVRRASTINMMGTMAKLTKFSWESIGGYQKRALERMGVDEKTWKIWQAAKPYKQNGVEFLTKQDIRDAFEDPEFRLKHPDISQRDIDRAVTTYIAFLTDESGIASLNPDLGTRAATNLGFERGTIPGEALRCVMLFKSFPLSFMRRHLERISEINQTEGRASAAGYAATIFVASTFTGAISVQLAALASGRDLQDMSFDNEDFWMQAMAKGGGAGFLSDVIIAGFDGKNAYGSPNFVRFAGPVINSGLDTWDVLKTYYNEAMGDEEIGLYDSENSGHAKALRLLRGHTPFVNLWYTKGVFDRAVYNDIMEFVSPGYLDRVQSWALKNTGQEMWWDMTQIKPTRMPRMSEAPED